MVSKLSLSSVENVDQRKTETRRNLRVVLALVALVFVAVAMLYSAVTVRDSTMSIMYALAVPSLLLYVFFSVREMRLKTPVARIRPPGELVLELDESGIMAPGCLGAKIPWSEVEELWLSKECLDVWLKEGRKMEPYTMLKPPRAPRVGERGIGIPIAELGGQRYKLVDFAAAVGVRLKWD